MRVVPKEGWGLRHCQTLGVSPAAPFDGVAGLESGGAFSSQEQVSGGTGSSVGELPIVGGVGRANGSSVSGVAQEMHPL